MGRGGGRPTTYQLVVLFVRAKNPKVPLPAAGRESGGLHCAWLTELVLLGRGTDLVEVATKEMRVAGEFRWPDPLFC